MGETTSNSDESVVATAYPTAVEYETWKDEADSLGMSLSEYIQSMTRAGRKKFGVDIDPDQTNQELREARNYYREELEKERRKNERLENQLHGGERSAVESFVQANPGVTYDEIVEHVVQTASQRVSSHLDTMSGTDIYEAGDSYYPIKDRENEE